MTTTSILKISKICTQVAYICWADRALAVAVFGNFTAIGVKILTFKRFDNFGPLFAESEDLAVCRDGLVAVGFSMDLLSCGLGPGKLVVPSGIAAYVMENLRERHRSGKILKRVDVVVSADWEPVVRCLVKNNPATSNSNPVKNEPGEILHVYPRAYPDAPPDRNATVSELSRPRIRVERTFLDEAYERRSDITRSTTDAHFGPALNPRVTRMKTGSQSASISAA